MNALPYRHFAAAIGLLLLIYLVCRAIYTPIVHDEAATYFHYIQQNRFFPFYAHWDANNHFLNSLGTWLCMVILGKSLFALRLLNVMAFVWYAYSAYQISEYLNSKALKIACFTALLSTQFVLEFFAMARGYGLSLAFFMWSLNALFSFIQSSNPKYLGRLALALSLAIWSNLSLFNCSLLIAAVAGFHVLKSIKLSGIPLRSHFQIFIFGVLPHLVALLYLLELKHRGLLYYGSLDGFFAVTVKSLVQFLAYSQNSFVAWLLIGTIAIVVTISILFSNHSSPTKSFLTSTLTLLLGNWLIIELLAVLLKVNYPEDRAAIYFIPLAILVFSFAVNEMRFKGAMYLGLVLLFFPIASLIHMNLNGSILWPEQSLSKKFYDKIQQQKTLTTVACYPLQQMDWAFYNLNSSPNAGPPQIQPYPSNTADWQIVQNSELKKVAEQYDVVLVNQQLDQVLLKRKAPLEKRQWVNVQPKATPESFDGEYFNLYEQKDSLWPPASMLHLSFKLETKTTPFHAQFVISVDDSLGQNVLYDYVPLHWLQTTWNGQVYEFIRNLENMPDRPKRVVIYLWNIDKVPFNLKEIKLGIHALTENSSFTHSN